MMHGTAAGYKAGCRCPACREWKKGKNVVERRWAAGYGERERKVSPTRPLTDAVAARILGHDTQVRAQVRRVWDRDHREDLVQETYLSVLVMLQNRAPPDDVAAYLVRTAQWKVIGHFIEQGDSSRIYTQAICETEPPEDEESRFLMDNMPLHEAQVTTGPTINDSIMGALGLSAFKLRAAVNCARATHKKRRRSPAQSIEQAALKAMGVK